MRLPLFFKLTALFQIVQQVISRPILFSGCIVFLYLDLLSFIHLAAHLLRDSVFVSNLISLFTETVLQCISWVSGSTRTCQTPESHCQKHFRRGCMDLRFYQQDRKVPGSPQHRQNHPLHFSYGQGLAKQILIFVGKADPLPFYFLTGLFPAIWQNSPPARAISCLPCGFCWVSSLALIVFKIISSCVILLDLQSYGKCCQNWGCVCTERARSVQPVAKVGNWRINLFFFFWFENRSDLKRHGGAGSFMPGQPEPRLHPLNIQDFLRTDTKNISDFLIPVFIIPLPYRPSPDILPMWRNRCRQGSLWVCFSKGCVGVGLYQRSKAE